jgi:hypothetical protein
MRCSLRCFATCLRHRHANSGFRLAHCLRAMVKPYIERLRVNSLPFTSGALACCRAKMRVVRQLWVGCRTPS